MHRIDLHQYADDSQLYIYALYQLGDAILSQCLETILEFGWERTHPVFAYASVEGILEKYAATCSFQITSSTCFFLLSISLYMT